jgi:hypothetical protein
MMSVRSKPINIKPLVASTGVSQWHERRLLAWRICHRMGDPALAREQYRLMFPKPAPLQPFHHEDNMARVLRDFAMAVRMYNHHNVVYDYTPTTLLPCIKNVSLMRDALTAMMEDEDDSDEGDVELRMEHDLTHMLARQYITHYDRV